MTAALLTVILNLNPLNLALILIATLQK